MPITSTVHADFRCNRCDKSIPLSYRQEDDRQSLDSCRDKCIENAKKKGWRVTHESFYGGEVSYNHALCPSCDKRTPCSHGHVHGSCVKEDCTHKREA